MPRLEHDSLRRAHVFDDSITASHATDTRADGRTLRRLVFWTVAATAVLYAPLAVSYMWFAFDAGAPRLQEALSSAIDGRAYVTGSGSVRAIRAADYANHRLVMLIHTTLGGLALVLATFQYSGRVRKRRDVHRWFGRVYLTMMTASMLAAVVFLASTSSVRFPGQSAFRLQLWVLAVSTLGTAWIAFAAIRRGDKATHRAWVGLNVSFMMTAPLLRVLWTVLAPVFAGQVLLTNLDVGAVMLAVVAPAAGAIAFLVTDSSATQPEARSGTFMCYALLAAVAVAGAGVLVAVWDLIAGEAGLPVVPWFHVVPALGYMGVCAVGAIRAKAAGDACRERKWRWLMIGAALASWAALLVGGIGSLVYGPVEGYIAGLMVGPGAPITMMFAFAVSARVPAGTPRPFPVVAHQDAMRWARYDLHHRSVSDGCAFVGRVMQGYGALAESSRCVGRAQRSD